MNNININALYVHQNGETVKVLVAQFNRVALVRTGFEEPVIMSLSQFSKEYTAAKTEVNA